jgi:hypothetical protein
MQLARKALCTTPTTIVSCLQQRVASDWVGLACIEGGCLDKEESLPGDCSIKNICRILQQVKETESKKSPTCFSNLLKTKPSVIQ